MVRLEGDHKARHVASMFDSISKRYDFMNNVMSMGLHHKWKRRASGIASHGKNGDALDIATGTGDFAIELAKAPAVTRVVGLDLAPKMLPLAEQKANRKGLSQKLTWILGSAGELPFVDNQFICTTVGFGLRNFPDRKLALTEMLRVVRPGGRVVILDIVPLGGNGGLQRLKRLYFNGMVPKLGMLLAGNGQAYRYLPESVEHYMTADQLMDLMRSVGLINVYYELMGFGTVALHVGEKSIG